MSDKLTLGLDLTSLHSEKRARSAGRVAQIYLEGFSRVKEITLCPYAHAEFPLNSFSQNGSWQRKLWGHWDLAWQFKQAKPDLIQIIDPFKIPSIKPAPVVTLVHNLVPFIYRDRYQHSTFLRYLYRRMKRQLINSDAIISPSRKTTNTIQMMFSIPRERIKTIYHGVNSKQFYPRSNSAVKAICKKYRISPPYFLMVADMSSYDPHKGLETVSNRWKSKHLSSASLVIAGRPGCYSKQLKTSWQSHPEQLIFPGFVNDEELAVLYSGARGVIYPSTADGFCFPALEAIACGTRPIVRYAGAVKELVGEPAIKLDENLFEDELVPALRAALNDPLPTTELDQHREKFTQKKTIQQLHDFYSELI